MTKKTNTKRALLMSALALLLCLSMLVGSTFAWFTDEVTSGNNIIQSGTLDIAMEWANGKEDPATANWIDASTGAIFNNDKWEPGYTEARHIKISNKGTLALRWNLAIVPNGTVSNLADVIDVYAIGLNYLENTSAALNAKQVADRDALTGFTYVGTLAELLGSGIITDTLLESEAMSFTLVLKMREEAGNEYQNLSIGTDFSIKLIANQFDYEVDSFDKNYDKLAGKTAVTPANAQEAIYAAQPGDVIYLGTGIYGDLVLENADGTPKTDITIEGQGGNVSACTVESININSSVNVTLKNILFEITGAEAVYGKSGNASGYVSNIIGAKSGANTGAKNVVIDNCSFKSSSSYDVNTYVPISFEEQGRPTSRATNITIMNCKTDPMKNMFQFARLNYLAEGTVIVKNNSLLASCQHNVFNLTGNGADIIVKDNTFGWIDRFSGDAKANAWNPEKAAIGTSRQGTHTINVEITGNTFAMKDALTSEGVVVELKSTYTTDNCTVKFSGNTFAGSLAGMTEATVPCNMP